MVIASRTASASYNTDPVAQTVRGLMTASARLESHAQAEPAKPAELNLARLYPSVFADTTAPSFAVRTARLTSTLASAAAAVLALVVGVLHHS